MKNCIYKVVFYLVSLVALAQAADAQPTATLDANNTFCGMNNGSAEVYPAGGTGTYTYLWSNSSTQDTVSGLAPGNYSVTVYSGTDSVVKAFTIAASTVPTLGITAARDTICLGSSDLLTASGGTMGDYVWSGGTLGGSVTADSIDVTTLTAGNYTFTVTENGCTATATYTIVAGPVIASLFSVVEPTCGQNNGTITCNTVSFVSVNTFLRNDTVISSGGGTTLDNAGPGTYTFIVYDSRTGCSDTVSNIILEDTSSVPSFTNIVIDSEQCFGNKKGAIYVTVGNCTSGCIYSWSSSSTDATDSAVGLPAGLDTFFVSKGGCSNIDTILNVPGPTAALSDSLAVTPDHCSHDVGKAVANITGGSGPYTYIWSAGTATGDSTVGLTGDSSIEVTVTDIHGCTVTDSGYVSSTPGPGGTMQNSDTICAADNSGILIATPTTSDGPFTYTWSNSGNQTSNIDAGLSPGNYKVTISDAFGCDTVLLGVVPAYTPSEAVNIVPSQSVAQGQTVTVYLEPNVPVTNVIWDPYVPGSTGATEVAFVPQQTTTFSVTITYGNSCTIVDTFQVGVFIDSAPFKIPNTFTPNGDGINDFFKLIEYPSVSSFHIWIYDRWGNKVYESTDVEFQWNGMDQYAGNKPFDPGVFAYVIEYAVYGSDKGNQTIGGNISLVR